MLETKNLQAGVIANVLSTMLNPLDGLPLPPIAAGPQIERQSEPRIPSRVTPADIEEAIVSESYHVFPGTTVTVAMLTLRNGAKSIGYNYGSIDPAQQDWTIGHRAARAMAVERVWELEGYALRERLTNTQ